MPDAHEAKEANQGANLIQESAGRGAGRKSNRYVGIADPEKISQGEAKLRCGV